MAGLVFQSTNLSTIKLRNRIFRSATHEGLADELGVPTEALTQLYVRLAKGGVGAIITGYAGIQQNGRSNYPGMMMIDRDELIPVYKKMVAAVHEAGAPLILQIAHCGRQTRSKVTGEATVAPSPIKDKYFPEDLPHEMTEAEIEETIERFVAGIVRARAAGFDGVQLHIAHGYLLSEFFSPAANQRQDRWGGSVENRFRIVGEIFKRARVRVGTDYPVLVKMNGHEGHKQGLRIAEAVNFAKLLEAAGCSAIEVSCGLLGDGLYTVRGPNVPVDAFFTFTESYRNMAPVLKTLMKPVIPLLVNRPEPIELYNVDAAQAIKQAVSIPVIVVGGVHRLDNMEKILKEQQADFISLSRPFIIEPNLLQKFQTGKQEASRCIKCNYCVLGLEVAPLRCYYGKVPAR